MACRKPEGNVGPTAIRQEDREGGTNATAQAKGAGSVGAAALHGQPSHGSDSSAKRQGSVGTHEKIEDVADFKGANVIDCDQGNTNQPKGDQMLEKSGHSEAIPGVSRRSKQIHDHPSRDGCIVDKQANRGDESTRGVRDSCNFVAISTSSPENTTIATDDYCARGSRRHSLLRVLGFAAEFNPSSRQASVALIGEWPGVGSLHDLLEGETGMPRRASQEDMLRWTRQAAEGLVHCCADSSGCNGTGGGLLMRISTRNVFLFPRPKDDLTYTAAEVLDAKVW